MGTSNQNTSSVSRQKAVALRTVQGPSEIRMALMAFNAGAHTAMAREWSPLTLLRVIDDGHQHGSRSMSSDEILTTRDVTVLLKVGEKTVYTLAQAGDLPGRKLRGQGRFKRSVLDAWIHRQVERPQAHDGLDDEGGDR